MSLDEETIQIYLDSKYAIKRNGNAGDAYFSIPSIYVEDGNYIYLSVVSCIIPYSFYNINSTNNVLTYDLVGGPQLTFSVPVGNYNINQLLTYINNNWTGFTATLNVITNKITITKSTANDFTIYSQGLGRILGFTSNAYGSSGTAYAVTSASVANLYTITNVNVETNLLTYNVSNISNQTQNRSILASIPVTVAPFSLISYENKSLYKTNLYVGEFNNLSIRLLDNNGAIVDMNGVDYTITLQISVVPFRA